MKKIVLILTSVACSTFCVLSQTYKVYTFQYNAFGTPPCSLVNNPDWKASHGSPSYGIHPMAQLANYNYLQLEAKDWKGEGVFANYNFSKCNNYRIEIILKDASIGTRPTIYVCGANGLSEKNEITCDLATTPPISDLEIINYEGASCSGLWVAVYQCTLSFPSTNFYWNPNKNYNQLWIYSFGSDTGAFVIEKITIIDYGRIETSPPTIPGNLRVANTTGSTITVQWDPSTDNSGIEEYEVSWYNQKWITKHTQHTITGRQPCTDHTIEVRARDKYCNYSPKTSIIATTTDNLPVDAILQSPITLLNQPNSRYIVQTTNSITLTPGFSVQANNSQEYFLARISSGCGDILLSSPPSPNGENQNSIILEE